jgi:RNA polymerase sigma-70 factor (ECF subfamily)
VHDAAERLDALLVDLDEQTLSLEFEARLADSSALAVRVAYSVLRHQQDAEDVAQEAFARAFRRFRSLRDRDRFRAWLVRITWRLALDCRRGSRRRTSREDAAASEPIHQAPDAEAGVLARERSGRLWAAIDALPEKLRVAVVLSAIEGHGIRDVAALLAIPEGTVKSRLFDARKRLQELLK